MVGPLKIMTFLIDCAMATIQQTQSFGQAIKCNSNLAEPDNMWSCLALATIEASSVYWKLCKVYVYLIT